jgi:hypothetical protein
LLLALVAACSPGVRRAVPTPAPPSASAPPGLCAAAYPGRTIKGEVATTVGKVRALRVGPGMLIARDAFPGVPDRVPAAWCWLPEEVGAATAGRLPVRIVSGNLPVDPYGPRIP